MRIRHSLVPMAAVLFLLCFGCPVSCETPVESATSKNRENLADAQAQKAGFAALSREIRGGTNLNAAIEVGIRAFLKEANWNTIIPDPLCEEQDGWYSFKAGFREATVKVKTVSADIVNYHLRLVVDVRASGKLSILKPIKKGQDWSAELTDVDFDVQFCNASPVVTSIIGAFKINIQNLPPFIDDLITEYLVISVQESLTQSVSDFSNNLHKEILRILPDTDNQKIKIRLGALSNDKLVVWHNGKQHVLIDNAGSNVMVKRNFLEIQVTDGDDFAWEGHRGVRGKEVMHALFIPGIKFPVFRDNGDRTGAMFRYTFKFSKGHFVHTQ